MQETPTTEVKFHLYMDELRLDKHESIKELYHK